MSLKERHGAANAPRAHQVGVLLDGAEEIPGVDLLLGVLQVVVGCHEDVALLSGALDRSQGAKGHHIIGTEQPGDLGMGRQHIGEHGLALFMDKGCVSCHNGVNVGGQGYFPFGLVKKPGADILPVGDKGRFAVTKTASEQYVFRAAPLRNIELTAPYFHSGAVWDLEEAVAVMGTAQLGTELKRDEVKDIVAFLRTLTGERPAVEYPILPVSTVNTPKPAPMLP